MHSKPRLSLRGTRRSDEWQNLTTFSFVKKRNVQFAHLPINMSMINCVILLCGPKESSFGPVLVYKVESNRADNLATVCGNSEMMGIYGNYILTNTALCVRISMSMKVDNGEHVQTKDHSGQAVVFHLGYLSFSFPSNHLLRIKMVIMCIFFLTQEVKTLSILYHICKTNQLEYRPAPAYSGGRIRLCK